MPATLTGLQRKIERRYKDCPIGCERYQDTVITSLGHFLDVFDSLLGRGRFWFRGHSRLKYKLVPSALRYQRIADRDKALRLVFEMRRFLEMKLPAPPASDNHLGWLQVAQHYGLPTRLLDWTQNAAVALFFACFTHQDEDGLVVMLNPLELNSRVALNPPRIFDPQTDTEIIQPYFELGGAVNPTGLPTIAINPTWNTERIALQQGVFTLHGDRKLALDRHDASSLVYVPILKEYKRPLLHELERIGIAEMFIFPEPEHVCANLRRNAGL